MELEKIFAYRMTHINNVPHILQHGITHRNSPNRNRHFVTIGDISLIGTRNNKQVSVDNGDSSNPDVQLITLGNFIPFYFGVRMPMLYVIQHGGNFVIRATAPADIVYLACSVKKIAETTQNFYFSDGHGTDEFTTFYDNTKIDDLPELIDWTAVKATYWSGNENLILKRKKQAEFLVSDDISPDLIVGMVCYNETAKNKLLEMGIGENKIKVRPQAYY